MRVFSYMKVLYPNLTFIDQTIAVIKTGLSFAQLFYFGSCQYNSRIVFIIDEILKVSRTIFDLRHPSFPEQQI